MEVEREGFDKQRQTTSFLDSIELVENVVTCIKALEGGNADETLHADGGGRVDGITRVVLAEQRTTSAASPSIWALLLFPPVLAQLELLDLSFNALDDTFWAMWAFKDDGKAFSSTAKWPALSVLALSNNR
jgi:hypothetical protein